MEPQNKSGRRGCLFYGAIVVGIFLVLLGLGLAFGISMAKKVRNEFTDAAPQVLPASPLSTTQYRDLEQRIKSFSDSMQKGVASAPLDFSAEELNALIDRDEGMKQLRGKVHVVIEGEKLRAQLSLPMGEIGLPVFRDRYLNALADIHPGLAGSNLRVTVTNIVVRGKSIPNIYLRHIQKQNLAETFNNYPGAGEVLKKLESIQVTNNHLRIVPKTAP